MKKIAAIALVCVMSLGLLAGCGESGGFDAGESISVMTREDGSGTRGAFVELMGIEQEDENGEDVDYTTTSAAVTNSTSVMMTSVAGDRYAIGYISLGSLDDTVKAIAIDGVEPSVDNIKAGSYAVSRPFHIATMDDLSPVAQEFIDFILSDEGQAIVEEEGYISIGSTGAFRGQLPAGKIVISGSSSVTPVMEKLVEAYQTLNSGVDIELQAQDSTTGMTNAIDGVCDIGMASRDLKDSELEKGLTPTVIAMDGIAVIVNKENPVEGLTSEQVMNIFTGELADWDSVGE